jgi:transcriptional regulator with XRE-family HTH domain
MLETSVTMATMENTILPDSPARRISLRIWQLGLKKKDVAEAMGYRASFISDVSNGNKELSWNDTKKLANILGTTTDYLLCNSDNPEPYKEKEPAPFYEHEESDALAKLADEQPDWLRRQILAVAHAQVDSIKEGTSAAQDEQHLRETMKMLVLIVGKDEAHRIVDDAGRQLQHVRVGVGNYRQLSLSKS